MPVMFQLNEQKLQLLGLTDDLGTFVNNALVQATMKDLNGVVIAELNNVTLVSIDTNGNYSYTIPATFTPRAGFGYVCIFTASVGGVQKLRIEKPMIVEIRNS